MDQQPQLIWDKGSAYDLFVSLSILHEPEEFGLRPSWAAGVRSRLPIHLRDVLDQTQKFLNVPLRFIYELPEPKDAKVVIEVLEALPPEDRLPAIYFGSINLEARRAYRDLLLSLDGKQRLTAATEAQIKEGYRPQNRATRQVIRALFDAWADRKQFGIDLLDALKAYMENFYQEEEIRIIPAQETALTKAQEMSETTDVLTLLEKLSAGVRMDWISEVSTLVLAPSFWGAPFMFFSRLNEQKAIVLFGARPDGMALVPGDLVPEDLLNALKALADPTRLRILRYLLEGPSTPSELSKILRLRPPTVTYHLHNLRLAGMVQVTVSPEAERQYALRMDGVNATVEHFRTFLSGD